MLVLAIIALAGIAYILIDEAVKRRREKQMDRLLQEHYQRRKFAVRTNDCTDASYWQDRDNVAELAADWLDFVETLRLCQIEPDEKLRQIRDLAGYHYTKAMQCGGEK